MAYRLPRTAVCCSFASDVWSLEMGEELLSHAVSEVSYLAGPCIWRGANANVPMFTYRGRPVHPLGEGVVLQKLCHDLKQM